MQQQEGNMNGGNGSHPLHDMQRMQQMAQYRQQNQQQQVGMVTQQNVQQQNSFSNPGLVQQHMNQSPLVMQQQQQQQQQQSINNNAALSMMHQTQQQHPVNNTGLSNSGLNQNSFSNGTSSASSGNWMNASSGLMNQNFTSGSTMDASSGTSARLMAMAGMGGGLSSTSTGIGNNLNMMGGMVNGISGNSNSINVQAILQQRQQNIGKSNTMGIPSNFNLVQDQQSLLMNQNITNKLQQQHNPGIGVVSSALMNMGTNSSNNGNVNQLPANMTPQQQQFFVQQQLAVMQMQQQQPQRNSIGGGSSGATSGNALSMQNGQQLHHQSMSTPVGVGETNERVVLNNTLQSQGTGQNALQQRQQMQQQQQTNSAVSGNCSVTGNDRVVVNSTLQNQSASQNLLQQRQQELYQQMQQQPVSGNQSFQANSMGMIQQLQQQQQQQQQQGNGNSGILQHLMTNLRQQQQQGGDMSNIQMSLNSNSSNQLGMMNSLNGLGMNTQQQLNQRSTTGNQGSLFGNSLDSSSSNVVSMQGHQSQQHTSNLTSTTGSSSKPMGLSNLNNMTGDQRHRSYQQDLLNSTQNSSNVIGNPNSNMGNSMSTQMFGGGGSVNGININAGSNNLPDQSNSQLSAIQCSQNSVNQFQAGSNVGSEMNSGQNTPSNIGTGLSGSSGILDQEWLSLQNSSNGTTKNMMPSSGNSVGSGQQEGQRQKSFLDGRFAGGWQSNKDIPDRRRVIFNILDVIRQMRPDTSKMSDKLPHMAKSLEEHLYRSAKSKEDYMELSTLKKRLQTIAHGLEIHREGCEPGVKRSDSRGSNDSLGMNNVSDPSQSASVNINPSLNESLSQQQNADWANGHSSNLMTGNQDMSQLNQANAMSSGIGTNNQNSGNHGALMGVNPNVDQSNFLNHNMQIQQLAMSQQNVMSGNMPVGIGFNVNQNQPNEGQQQMSNMMNNSSGLKNNLGFQQQNMSALANMNIPGNALDLSMNSNFSNAPSNQVSQNNSLQCMGGQGSPFIGGINSGVNKTSQPQQQIRQNSESGWASIDMESTTLPASSNGGTNLNGKTKASNEPGIDQKKKVILQQQQRLLLLRHASKCTAGSDCHIKFCEQMVTLWKHMKTCRNKNCKTPHCFSSRCVLNHYRICKSNGKTATCEVCGPVMLKIKQQERDDGSADPLTVGQEAQLSDIQSQNVTSSDQSQAQNSQRAALLGQDIDGNHANQAKYKTQLDTLKILQKKQEEMLKQQERIEEQAKLIQDANSPKAHENQQQQIQLYQLQKLCQQQELQLKQQLQAGTRSNSQVEPMVPSSSLATVQQPQNDKDGKERTSAEPELVKSRGILSEGKGKRIASKGKRGKFLGALSKSGDRDASRKRKNLASISAKERAQKKSKVGASKQKSSDDASQTSENHHAVAEKDDESVSSASNLSKGEKNVQTLKKLVLSPKGVTSKCMPVLQDLLDEEYGWVFKDAVDPDALKLYDYFDVIKNPMHLDLVRQNLEKELYIDIETFIRDTKLVFENAILYNGESSEVGRIAQSLLNTFESSLKVLQSKDSISLIGRVIDIPSNEPTCEAV